MLSIISKSLDKLLKITEFPKTILLKVELVSSSLIYSLINSKVFNVKLEKTELLIQEDVDMLG